MLAKSVCIVVVVVCLAGPIVSWSQVNKRHALRSSDGAQYKVCSLYVKTAKETQFLSKQKPLLDLICALKDDKTFVDKCKKTVAKYLDDIAQGDPEKVCQQINVPDEPKNDSTGLRAQAETSVCEFLVDYANSKGSPKGWLQPLRNICPKMEKGHAALCQLTINNYYEYMTNESNKEFCARFNLTDV